MTSLTRAHSFGLGHAYKLVHMQPAHPSLKGIPADGACSSGCLKPGTRQPVVSLSDAGS
jgi:hypothetical protein